MSPGHTEGTGRGATVRVGAVGQVQVGASCAPDVRATNACEIRNLLDRLGGKWSLLVVELLGHGTHRFTELRQRIDGVSQRMLTLTLRQLERDGLVRRTVHPVVPPRVDYDLTALGRTLLDAVAPLVTWARAHRDEIAAARATHDARSGHDAPADEMA